MKSSHFKKDILDKLNAVLKPKRFRKNSNIFSFSNNDLTYYICVQNTVDSTEELLKTTVNVEIASSTISFLDDMSLPGYLQRHFVKNIGDYSGTQDKWWTICSEETAQLAQQEITDIITNQILPEIEQLKSTQDLAVLWQKKVTPGITAYQSNEYLALLQMGK